MVFFFPENSVKRTYAENFKIFSQYKKFGFAFTSTFQIFSINSILENLSFKKLLKFLSDKTWIKIFKFADKNFPLFFYCRSKGGYVSI